MKGVHCKCWTLVQSQFRHEIARVLLVCDRLSLIACWLVRGLGADTATMPTGPCCSPDSTHIQAIIHIAAYKLHSLSSAIAVIDIGRSSAEFREG